MRGAYILGDSSTTSICAFCAHRSGAIRARAQAQRRSIQSSRPASKPPASAAALQDDDESSQYGAPGATKTLPDASDGNRGRPAFGRASATSNLGRPAFGSGTIELTEDELRAKRMVEESSQEPNQSTSEIPSPSRPRPISIYAGPGPESTRAGRPMPMPTEVIQALQTSARAKESAMTLDRERLRIGAPPVSNNTQSQSGLAQLRNWRHLQKRTKQQEYDQAEDPFMRGRNEREVVARSQRFTSLSGQPPSETDSNSSNKTSNEWSIAYQPRAFGLPGRRANTISWDRRSAITSGMDHSGYANNPPNHAEAFGKDTKSQNDERESHRDRREPAWSQTPKYEAEHSGRSQRAERTPRGRERDKARRRDQFITSDAEANAAEAEHHRVEARKQRRRDKAAARAATPTPILLPEYISVSNLAAALKIRLDDFIEKMEELGFEETDNDYILTGENAGLIAMEYNFEPIINRGESEDLKARPQAEDRSSLPQRPPVVTIMGHVDHGKTTLLDWLRKSSVAATEHGGITQHIGAFSVPMPSGQIITFLDTPGHAAFLSMRQRGANVTDIVVLVVAADDSVKPQTIEAINHAKAAKVPIIVAINKIDKEDANIQRVKQDLARYSVDVEDFGGDTQVVCVSGKTGQGMHELEEAIITLSEIVDMRAERDGPAEGWVLETSMNSAGKAATVLVRRGTMRPGDFIVAGQTWAKIRTLRDETGSEIDEALPGTPVQIEGWREQPLAGDEVLQAPDESKAKNVVDYRLEQAERDSLAHDMEAINEERKETQERREREKMEAEIAAKQEAEDLEEEESHHEEQIDLGPKLVHFIVKGDVSGSVEAINDSISAIGSQEIQPRILRSGVGQISEFDIEHASAADGFIINFNIPIDPYMSRLAERSKVKILDHNVIYRLVDDVKDKLSGFLPPLVSYKVIGEADIAQIFSITIKGRQQKPIAGCKVRNGTVSRSAKVRVFRKGVKVFDGSLESLKNGKKDVTEMHKGNECGIGFEGWLGFQEGDQVQSYETIEEKRHL